MNLALHGSQISRDKNKCPVNDLDIKNKIKPNTTNLPNRTKFISKNYGLEITPLSSERKSEDTSINLKNNDSESARTKSSNRSGTVKVSKNVNSKRSTDLTKNTRKGTLDTFLDLENMSNDYTDKDGVMKWLKEQDIKDWEEFSISSNKNSSKRGTESNECHIFPINKNAFESQNYSQNFNDDTESTWYASERTLTPTSNVDKRKLNHHLQENNNKNFQNEELRQMSAKIIQSWFRRHLKRRRLAQAAMRRMLSSKQADLKQQQSSLDQLESVRKSISCERTYVQNKKCKPTVHNKLSDSKNNQKKITDKEIAEKEIEKLKLENKISSRPNSSRLQSSRPKSRIGNQNPVTNHQVDNHDVKHEDNQSLLSVRTNDNHSAKEVDNKSLTNYSEITTIDDILSTIKELESVDCLTDRTSKKSENLNSHKSGWNAITEDIEKLLKPEQFRSISNLQPKKSNEKLLTANALDMHNNMISRQSRSELDLSPNKAKQSVISDSKMNSILHFLNASEIVDNISELEEQPSHDFPVKKWNVFDVKELEENTQTAVNEVSTKVMTMKLELEEKQRSIDMLQKALQQQRELTVRQVKETQKDLEKRIDCQKDEYEAALQRNHTFIDQLISKNELLQDKCNKLVVELKEKSQKYEEKIKSLTENNDIQLKKVEAKHVAAEKLRREKWEADKTKLIKEMTIKGMESEIAQLIANHKQELRKMKQFYENEIVQAGENSYEKYNRQVEELRKQLYKEKEEACQKEHDIIKDRFDQEMQRQIQILESQRKQLYEEISDERSRLNLLGNKQKSEIENLRKQLEFKEDKVGESMKLEHQQAKENMQRKFDAEIREMKSQIELEKHIWTETQNKKNEAWLLSREQEIKNEMKKSRDQEIEKVIQQLEEDNTQSKEEAESAYNNKLKRAKDKYEAEINELELSEKQAKEKYNQIRADYLEIECEHESLKVMIRQKEKEIDEIKQLYETLNRERDHVSDIIRQEFADRLIATEEENRKLKREISEIRAKTNLLQANHAEELERIQLSHQNDMTEVHNKVKEAIKRKEENMTDLKNQFQNETSQWQQKLTAAEKRSSHLESLLEQQRKHLLKLK